MTDCSDRRPEIWPNVKAGHFEVHDQGEDFAEVTEELWPTGFWERCRYEWSQPGSVTATVIDANTLEPGSIYGISVTSGDDGSRVEASIRRDFKRSVRGRVVEAINRLAGKQLLRSDLRRALSAIEKRSEGS